jgi:hypothetical protein
MRGLSGDFATMPLKDLVVYLGNRQASGTLALVREGVRKQVVLERGAAVNASSNVPREYLGQFLINLGCITEEQFERAFATQQETRVFLGRILVMIGLVTEDTLRAALAMKFRETVLEAFSWTEGSFTFEPDVQPDQGDGVDVRVSLLDIHKESDVRVAAWRQIHAAFPDGTATLTLKREQLVEEPRPGSIDEKVFQYIEQGQTLDEMALRLHATDFFLYNRLFAFYRLGAIVVNEPRTADFDIDVDLGLGDSPTAEQLLFNAYAFLAQGNLRDAFSVVRRSSQGTPTLDATLLLKQLEAAWYPQLKAELLVPRRVPALAVPAPQLARLPLSAPERYLLSRVDGKRDVGSIVRVAPLKEFDALAFFDRFAAQRWITWT